VIFYDVADFVTHEANIGRGAAGSCSLTGGCQTAEVTGGRFVGREKRNAGFPETNNDQGQIGTWKDQTMHFAAAATDPALELARQTNFWAAVTAIATVCGTIAVVATVIVAVFGHEIAHWWRGPRLVVEVGGGPDFLSENTGVSNGETVELKYIRARVVNTGKTTAKGSTGFLVGLETWNGGEFNATCYSDIMQLCWSYVTPGNSIDLMPGCAAWLDIIKTAQGVDARASAH